MGFPPQGVSTQLDFHAMGWKSNGFSEISIGFPRNGEEIPWDFYPMGFPTDFPPMGFPTHGISPHGISTPWDFPWDFNPMGFPPRGISTPWDFHPLGFPPQWEEGEGGREAGRRERRIHSMYMYISIYT